MRKPLPETANRDDWPRLVAKKVNPLEGRIGTLETGVAGLVVDVTALETATDWSLLGNYADDAAAATGGVAVGELYRNGSVVMVRVA